MEKQKILLTASTFPRWEKDKIPMFVYDLAQQLKKEYDVFVLAPHYEGAKMYEEMGGINVFRFLYFLPALEKLAYGGGVVNNLDKQPFTLLLLPFYVLSSILWFLFLTIRFRFSVINVHWIVPMGYLAAMFKPFLGYKLVVTSHGGDVYAVRNQAVLKYLPMKFFVNFVLASANKITAVSSGVRDFIFKNFSTKNLLEKIAVIPMGIHSKNFDKPDISKFEKDSTSEVPFKILFVGRMVEKKGFEYLIEAIKHLEGKLNVHVDAVGNGPLLELYKQKVLELGIANRFTFHGFVYNADIGNHFKGADIFVGPSVTARNGDQEGLPVVYMEGMAAGLPVIATDVAGITDLITNGKDGIIVPQKDATAIAKAVFELAQSPAKREKLSQRALEKVKSFDWSEIGTKFIDMFKNMIPEKKKKLLVVGSTFPRWKNDKLSNFVYHLSHELTRDFDVSVLAPHFAGAKLAETMDDIKVHRFVYSLPMWETLAYGGGAVNNLKKSKLSLLLVPFYLLSNLLTMIWLMVINRYDSVHIHWIFPTGFIAALLKPIFKFRLVLTSHGGDIYGLKGMSLWKTLRLDKVLNFIINRADHVTTVSSSLKKEIVSMVLNKDAEKKISILPMGIFYNKFHLRERNHPRLSKDKEVKLLFVGRHAEEKAIQYLIYAIEQMRKDGYNIKATLVGDGPERLKLEDLANSLGILDYITFPGYINNDNIPEMFYSHDIFVNCSLREGLPTVYMEAMASGIPLVVTNTQGISDMLTDGENAMIVEMKNPAALANACAKIIDDQTLFEKLSKNGLSTAQKYDWKLISSQYAHELLG